MCLQNQLLPPAILATLPPANSIHPKIEKYNGERGPQAHIWQIDNYLQLFLGETHLRAKLFKGTLIGKVAIWYNNLPAKSINLWDELMKAS